MSTLTTEYTVAFEIDGKPVQVTCPNLQAFLELSRELGMSAPAKPADKVDTPPHVEDKTERTCKGTTLKGTPCRIQGALVGEDGYCNHHRPGARTPEKIETSPGRQTSTEEQKAKDERWLQVSQNADGFTGVTAGDISFVRWLVGDESDALVAQPGDMIYAKGPIRKAINQALYSAGAGLTRLNVPPAGQEDMGVYFERKTEHGTRLFWHANPNREQAKALGIRAGRFVKRIS